MDYILGIAAILVLSYTGFIIAGGWGVASAIIFIVLLTR